MVAHRMSWLITLIAGILIVSCSAPLAPTAGPTPSAPPVSSPTQTTVQSSQSTQAAVPTAIPTQAPAPTTAPTQPVVPAATPTKAGAQSSSSTKLNMDEIFPPGPGRETVLDNCTTCHTFVPLVILQYSQAQWDLSARNHRDRVPRLSDADFQAAYAYLAKTFPQGHPVPKLPQNLLDTWTDY